jgi:sulfate permease, SulP family
MLAIIDSYRSGLFNRHNFLPNLLAGTMVGIVALPLAMAFAIASGVRPEQGIYTAIIAAVMVAIFGGSRVQIAGPTGAFIIILSAVTTKYGVSGLQLATFMAGFILVIMGVSKLGSVIKFIPYPVIIGFTSAIAIVIFANQWKDFFGLTSTVPMPLHFHEKVIILISSFPSFHKTTTALATLSLFMMVILPRIKMLERIPAPLVAMIVVTTVQFIFQFEGVSTIGSAFEAIPSYLPSFQMPDFSYQHIIELIGPSFTIAMLAAIESLLSAVVADGMAGTRHHSNQELIGQGLANILCPLFGGFAATGAIARTATNIRSGGNSPIAAITHSIVLLLIILFLAPLISYIPLCCLAAILFIISYNMSEVHHFISILKNAPYSDVSVLVITFLLTLFTDLVIAVNVGVILSVLLFVRRMSQSIQVSVETEDSLQSEFSKEKIAPLPKDILIYTIQGPFFFGAAEMLQQTLLSIHQNPKTIVFRLKNVPFMDITGLKTFYEIIQNYKKHNITVYLCEANERVTKKLIRAGFLNILAKDHIFSSCLAIFKEHRD